MEDKMKYIIDDEMLECFIYSLKLNKKHANQEGKKLIDEMLDTLSKIKDEQEEDSKNK